MSCSAEAGFRLTHIFEDAFDSIAVSPVIVGAKPFVRIHQLLEDSLEIYRHASYGWSVKEDASIVQDT